MRWREPNPLGNRWSAASSALASAQTLLVVVIILLGFFSVVIIDLGDADVRGDLDNLPWISAASILQPFYDVSLLLALANVQFAIGQYPDHISDVELSNEIIISRALLS